MHCISKLMQFWHLIIKLIIHLQEKITNYHKQNPVYDSSSIVSDVDDVLQCEC